MAEDASVGRAGVPLTSTSDARLRLVASLLAPRYTLGDVETRASAITALALGLWMDALVAGTGAGLNVPVWVASTAGAVLLAGRRFRRPVPRDRALLLVLAALLFSVFAWRDSVALRVFGWLGGTSLLFLGAALPAGADVRGLGVTAVLIAAARSAVAFGASGWIVAYRLLSGVSARRGGSLRALLRPALLAAPLLVVFGSLFVAADAVFEAQVARVFDINLDAVGPHVFRVLFGGWVSLALLWTGVATVPPHDIDADFPERHRLRRLEVSLVLGSLAVLFALFVAVQVRYLFGGASLVRASVTLTYGQYARRGFFELVIAALLLLPVLAGVNWARERSTPARRLFLGLAGALGLLLLVILASAWQRLAIYREAYGLTEARLYAVATLPWLVLTLATFFVIVVRGKMRVFLPLAGAYAVATLLALCTLNPDAFIVRTNAARVAEGQPFDAIYAASLSADAVPVLLSRLDAVPPEDRCEVSAALRRRATGPEDIRSWSYSRATASRQITPRLVELECG
jgi:hypothetical protein